MIVATEAAIETTSEIGEMARLFGTTAAASATETGEIETIFEAGDLLRKVEVDPHLAETFGIAMVLWV